jgi:Tfp pilus assembly protein PilO
MKTSNRLIVAMLLVTLLAGGFWILILNPKRQEASELSSEVEQLHSSLASAETQATEAEAARKDFPQNYSTLVKLGKAVPGDDETSSLLVELNHVAEHAGVKFEVIQLNGESGENASSTSAPQAGPSSPVTSTVPPTEAAAALAPLGSEVGSAGLSVMPYDLRFSGNFFHVADFIGGIDSLVETSKHGTEVTGRLITLNGFSLTEEANRGFPFLSANFSVTTYLVPPGQGVTVGATPAAPAASETAASPSTATPSSYTTTTPATQ